MDIKWVGCDSSNYSEGRYDNQIERLTLHWICGTLESADATFDNPSRNASAHYGVGDEDIHQWVKDKDTAWHCGDWLWNLKTIGIENEGGPNLPISDKTYKTLSCLVKTLCEKYSIPIDREHITAHSDYVATQCPGTLDIDKVIKLAKGGIMEYLKEDIPTEVEDKFKLKKVERYNKYWNFNDLIEDWKKMCEELDEIKDTLKNKLLECDESLDEAARQYNILESEKEGVELNLEALERDYEEIVKKHTLELETIQEKYKKLNTQHTDLLESYAELELVLDEGYAEQIKGLKRTIEDLEIRVIQLQRPKMNLKELFEAIGKEVYEKILGRIKQTN